MHIGTGSDPDRLHTFDEQPVDRNQSTYRKGTYFIEDARGPRGRLAATHPLGGLPIFLGNCKGTSEVKLPTTAESAFFLSEMEVTNGSQS